MIWQSVLGALIVILVLLRRSQKVQPAPAPKKIPAVILEYERLQKEKEERRKIKLEGTP